MDFFKEEKSGRVPVKDMWFMLSSSKWEQLRMVSMGNLSLVWPRRRTRNCGR